MAPVSQHSCVMEYFVTFLLVAFVVLVNSADVTKKPKVSPDQIEDLKSWAKSKEYLPEIPDYLAAGFLYKNRKSGNLSDLFSRRDLLDHFSIQYELPLVFQNRSIKSDPRILGAMKMVNVFQLPMRSRNGDKILYLAFNKNEDFSVVETMKLFNMVMEQMLRDDDPEDFALIIDMQNVTVINMMTAGMKFLELKNYANYMKTGAPTMLSGAHTLNGGMLLFTLRAFLQKTMSEKVMLGWKAYDQGNMRELYREIPREILPIDYGGNEISVAQLTANQYERLEGFDANEPVIDKHTYKQMNKDRDSLTEEIKMKKRKRTY